MYKLSEQGFWFNSVMSTDYLLTVSPGDIVIMNKTHLPSTKGSQSDAKCLLNRVLANFDPT